MRIMISGVAIEGGGAEQVIQDLATGLAERDHEVMIVFLEGTDAIVPELEARGIRCERLLARRKLADNPWADFTPSSILGFRKLIADFHPDILHSHIPRPTLWAALACRTLARRPRFFYTEHSVQEVYPRWVSWVYRAFLPITEAVIGVSDASTESFRERWKTPTERIWNGIRPERITPERGADAVRAELGAGVDTPVACNVANLTTPKAHDVLVAAMSEVGARLPAAQCWIAGSREHEPPTAEALERLIVERGLEDAVRLLGRRRDAADLMNACDLFVLSSRQEGFPITILEAMAAGRPVVATDVGGCAEAVVHGETGFIVPPEDPATLAEAITEVLSDRQRARKMGEAGRERVLREFTVGHMIEQHTALYERVLA